MDDFKKPLDQNQRDPWNLILGIFVFLVSLIVYTLTVQRTLSFWDCGEFITCAYILGIPHPPGTPLFILIGRIFSFIPIGDDPSFRINMISSLASAGAAMFGYFVAAWILKKWFAKDNFTGWNRGIVYFGAVIAALMLAFGRTNWGNSVEAEVYGTAMLFMMSTMYLVLLWVDNRDKPRGEAYLVLMAYLSTLALGVHMTSFLIVPMAFVLVVLFSDRPKWPITLLCLAWPVVWLGIAFLIKESTSLALPEWKIVGVSYLMFAVTFGLFGSQKLRQHLPVWWSFIFMCIVMIDVSLFFTWTTIWVTVACIVYYWEKISTGWIYSLAVPILAIIILTMRGDPFEPVFIISLVSWSLLTLIIYRLPSWKPAWRLSFLMVLACLIGYSVQGFIPVRAAQKPLMNMNEPDDWSSFKSFLERKQYGSENMILRALHRRGEWKNQFGNHARMGFWGFFSDQWGLHGRKFLVLFFIGLYGLYYTTKKHWKSGIFVFLLTLAGTVLMVIYMNFADGTHENPVLGEGHLEVRDRDYFWTPGFVMFGLLIGLGAAAIIDMMRQSLYAIKIPQVARTGVLALLCLLTLYLPVKAVAVNFPINDRSDNYYPYDYAWNILQSAREDAVLFTNGDNDTFPVWCLQYVYGIRPDVKIANLSLINTSWYITQLRDQLGVPMGLTDRQVMSLRHRRTADGVYRVQDQMIAEIIDQNLKNNEQVPIEFAVTVSTRNKNYKGKSLDPYMQMEGMALNVYYPYLQPNAVNVERTHDLYWNTFQFRGVTDPTIHKDENANRLLNNYIQGFLFLADTLQRAGEVDAAAAEVRKGIELVGGGVEPWAYLCRMYSLHERFDDAEKAIAEAPDDVSKPTLKLFVASAMKEKGYKQDARELFQEVYAENPTSRDAFNELFRFYFEEKMQSQLARLLHDYTTRNPGDEQILGAYQQLKQEAPELFVAESLGLDFMTEVDESDTGRHLRVIQLDSAEAEGEVSDTGSER